MQYPPSELVLNAKGQVYHLGLSPEQISNKVIHVGDQDRVDLVASFFDVESILVREALPPSSSAQ